MPGIVLVVLQSLLIVLLIWPWNAPLWSWPALALLLPGAALAIWTLVFNRPGNFNLTPEVKASAEFITGGPYAYVRHPMYVSVLLMGLGVVWLYQSWLKLLCWLALFAVLWIKSAIEERAMKQRFPGYGDYASMVGRFFPKIMIG